MLGSAGRDVSPLFAPRTRAGVAGVAASSTQALVPGEHALRSALFPFLCNPFFPQELLWSYQRFSQPPPPTLQSQA